MKLIIAGGRDFTDTWFIVECLAELVEHYPEYGKPELVCGMARGADITAHDLWVDVKLPIHKFPADWNKHGRSAGYIRNTQMADFADALVAFWDGQSKGTAHMINTMKKLNKPVHVFRY